ncbi:MAG: nucleoside recognition protein [Lachnospiraceae bacterium]|nr:nucleoside recognition protein [Lachnospiraceae bacterium]
MLNYFWAVMIIIGVVYGALTGNIGAVGEAAFSSAGEAVELCFTMCGVMAFWVGLMKVAERAGIVAGLTKVIRPFVHFMFPDIPKGHKAEQPISLNIIANVLGLGWAATPAGLEAMKELSELEKERNYNISNGSRGDRKRSVGNDTASNEMCDFLILNISSLQLIPVTMIAYRTQYGSEDPTAIIAPAIVATFCSTLAAIIFCKLMRMGNR